MFHRPAVLLVFFLRLFRCVLAILYLLRRGGSLVVRVIWHIIRKITPPPVVFVLLVSFLVEGKDN